MIAAGKESRDAFLRAFIGREMTVLFEQEHAHQTGWYEGKTENYITAVCESARDLSGELLGVYLERAEDGILYGRLE